MLDELLIKYAEQFKEAFPLYSVPFNEDELVKIIENCLESNKPYKVCHNKNVVLNNY